MHRSRSSLLTAAILSCGSLVALIACRGDGSTEPDSATPGLHVVAGMDARDTIEAVLFQPLTVRLAGQDGKPVDGALLRFAATETTILNQGAQLFPSMQLLESNGVAWSGLATATTDADGRASARIRMGAAAGTGRITVSAPALGLVDSASFTIDPGAAREIVMEPKDTAVMIGGTLTLRGVVRDRNRNPRADAVSYAVSSTRATVAGSALTGVAFGRVRVTGRAGTIEDSSDVSVVPRGTVAAYSAMENPTQLLTLYSFDVDGGNFRTVAPTSTFPGFSASMPASWSADGKTLVFHDFQGGGLSAAIFVIDVATGTRRRVAAPFNELAQEAFPVFTRDGTWIYYDGALASAAINTGETTLYRILPDGFGRELVGPSGALQSSPSPSPDGEKIASLGGAPLALWQTARGSLQVLTVATRQLVPLGLEGYAPAWSPVDDWIAFVKPSDLVSTFPSGTVYLVRSDGSELHALTTTREYLSRLAWSPDGKYLMATKGRARIFVIDAATGEEVPVPITVGGYGFIVTAWKK